MFRRFLNRQQAQTGRVVPDQLRSLNEANQLMENGKPGQAAPLFAALASALDNLRPQRAANLHARAAHAYADAGQESEALSHARTALKMFIQNGMSERVSTFYTNIQRKFSSHAMKTAATSLQNEFHLPQPIGPASAEASPARRGRLPGSCGKCGAPLRPAEEDWLDDHSAECRYCGAVVSTLE
jgi:hypothetical protein